jgi:hypothetical protein
MRQDELDLGHDSGEERQGRREGVGYLLLGPHPRTMMRVAYQ